MRIPPTYEKTPSIIKNLQRINSAKSVLEKLPISPELKLNIRRQSLLQSALYSARIEGNPLDLQTLNQSGNSKHKKEVQNILAAAHFLHQQYKNNPQTPININLVLSLHKQVMESVSTYPTGALRNEVSAIFNSEGFAVYVPPSPPHLEELLSKVFAFLNSSEETLIKAFLGHYLFEKIHPFFDGNGRVGRLLISALLLKEGYESISSISFEELLDSYRENYYQALDNPVTKYLEFMTDFFAEASEKQIEKVIQTTNHPSKKEDGYLPRRKEILNIIRDHKIVNIDFIDRRFTAINPRTLRFDLKFLVDEGLVKKLGTTKGVFYTPIETSIIP